MDDLCCGIVLTCGWFCYLVANAVNGFDDFVQTLKAGVSLWSEVDVICMG